ncbi:MAG: ABC transporter substrate-binding protein [Desulfobacterales bacterium RIFOXYA12_FULL_46_15]|nr:MAG: ABC transporter substrate-binding protein [Desulfobacterales bacterium RIFOXYA12_FULL_46_15]
MTRKTNFFKLGLFVIIAFGLGAAFLIIFGAGKFFKKELMAETCFNESVQGLSVGSEVKYKGIRIGSVKSITSAASIYKTKSDYVLVVMALEEDISLGQTGESAKEKLQNAVNDGLVIRLSFKGLTGVGYLETDYAAKNPGDDLVISWTPGNIYIPSQRSNMKQFGDSMTQILDSLAAINVKEITKDIETLLKTLDTKANDFDINNISILAASLLKELKETNQKISKAVETDKINHVLDDAKASFSELRGIVESSRAPFGNAINDFEKAAGSTKNMAATLEAKLSPKVDTLSVNLDKLVENLSAASGLLEHMVWLNSDRVRLIMENLETTSENLKQMSKDIKQYPGRLIFENPPEKTGTEKKN